MFAIVWLDNVIASLQHPAIMVLAGMLCWFTLRWSKLRNKAKKENKAFKFWDDQKDEIFATFAFGMTFCVFDDEVLAAWDYFTLDEGQPPTELHPFFYLLVGPVVERIYKMTQND